MRHSSQFTLLGKRRSDALVEQMRDAVPSPNPPNSGGQL